MARFIAKTGWRASIPLLAGVCLLIFSEPRPAAQTRLPQTGDSDPLPFGKAIDREMSGGEKHSYSYTLIAGQFVQAVVEQRGIDVTVAIFGPDGEQLAKVDRMNSSQGPETASLIAPSSGAYRLQIESVQSDSVRGRYRITLKEPRGAISSDEKRIAAEKLVFEGVQLWKENTADSLRKGAEKYELAQSLLSEAGDPFEEGIALYGAGLCHRSLGANQKAMTIFKRALELMQEAKDSLGIAIVHGGMGWTYFNLGALDQALECFKLSLQLRQGLMDFVGEARLYQGIGWVHIGRKENQLALENFKESMRLRQAAKDRKGAALTRIGLGRAYFRLERYDESRAMLEQALSELKDTSGQTDTLWHLGLLDLRLKEYEAAKEHFRRMLKLSLAPDDHDSDRYSEANARLGLAICARREGALSEALDQIKRGVEIIESLRTESAGSSRKGGDTQFLRITYFAQKQEFYEVYIDLLMRLDEREPGAGHAAEALYISECARARNLLDLLARAGANAPEQKALAQPLRVSDIQRALDEKTVLLEYALGSGGDAETDRSFLWLVTRTGVESHLLPKRAEIEAAAQRVYELLTARNHIIGPNRRELVAQADAQFLVEAKVLSRMLLGPVAAKLTGKRLLIAAQGALQFVPFAALPSPETEGRGDVGTGRPGDGGTGRQRDRENSRPNFSPSLRPSVPSSLRPFVPPSPRLPAPPSPRLPVSYTPLIAAHEVVVVPSASALAAIGRQTAIRKPAERSVIVFADPVFSAADERVSRTARRSSMASKGGKTPSDAISNVNAVVLPNLNRLSATDWEARRIASLAGDSRVVRNFAANLDAAVDPALGKYRYVHFATHAVINPYNPDLSAIVLSQVNEQGQPVDGLLWAKDIHQLKLPAELVVLSACRTGLGKDVPGEGLLSLTRGFLSSGAARVMTSLWAVEDQATAEIMNRFYRRALGPRAVTPAAALRAAQEEMWRENRWNPYYWGGFVLQGDWR